ncbi:MAG TPA: hypothetical protein ACFCUD_07030 [Cyclobacteriaceae bacterium]
MDTLILIISIVIITQIAIFFANKHFRKKENKDNIAFKYNIHSRGDAWRLINDLSIPEEDRKKIELIYQKGKY